MKNIEIIKSGIISIFCILYMLNIFAGLDLIPDYIPGIGNIDDGFLQ